MIKLVSLFLTIVSFTTFSTENSADIPNTGVSGVYEVMIGTDDADSLLIFLKQFGFELKQQSKLTAKQASEL